MLSLSTAAENPLPGDPNNIEGLLSHVTRAPEAGTLILLTQCPLEAIDGQVPFILLLCNLQ